MGLEPTTSAVTGRRSNQLNYQAIRQPVTVLSVSFPSGDYVIILHLTRNVNRKIEKNPLLFLCTNLFKDD